LRRNIAGILFAALAFAYTASAREVSITLDGAQTTLVLSNPSTVTVNYDISCHKADGSGTIIALTGQTLAPNTQVKHTAAVADTNKCASNANPEFTYSDANGKNYYFCNGSNTYANAGNACGTGNSFCFPDLNTMVMACTCSTFWIKNDGNAQIQPMCGSFGAVTGGNQIMIGTYSGGNARKSSSVNCAYMYYANEVATSSTGGAICCSSPLSGSVCKVTINTASTSAFLASPSFMGGAAF
jgi:hypothetical protein